MKKCPFCAEEIQEEAIKCKHCGELLETPQAQWATLARRLSGMSRELRDKELRRLTFQEQEYVARTFGMRALPEPLPRPPVDGFRALVRGSDKDENVLDDLTTSSRRALLKAIGIALGVVVLPLVVIVWVLSLISDEQSPRQGSARSTPIIVAPDNAKRETTAPPTPIIAAPASAERQTTVLFKGQSEKQLYCNQILSCGGDQFAPLVKRREVGEVRYYRFSPPGEPVPGIRNGGFSSLVMYNRPHTTADQEVTKFQYDEVWSEQAIADLDFNNRISDRDKLAGVSYAYWHNGRFVVSISYSPADLLDVPLSLVTKNTGRPPSAYEAFSYKKIKGEWLVLDSILDRSWFEAAVASLK